MFLDAHTIDQFLHPLGTGLLHLFRYVTVAIQCKSGGEVSHVFLKGFDVIASLETIYGEGMPEIVNPMVRQTGLFQYLLEFFPDGRLDVVISVRMGKNQSGEITFVPQGTGGELLCRLDGFVMLQDIHDELRGVNIPCLIVLQSAPVAFSTAALLAGRGQLLLNVDDSIVKINAVPGQADQFAATKTSEDVHKDQVLQFFALQGGEEAFLLFLVQRNNFFFHYFR